MDSSKRADPGPGSAQSAGARAPSTRATSSSRAADRATAADVRATLENAESDDAGDEAGGKAAGDPQADAPVAALTTLGGVGSDRPATSPLHILVVDDERDVCLFLEDFLANEGYRVRTASDPTQALELLRSDAFHVAIVDLMMPKMSGMDLLQQIRRVDDDIAVIIFTGYPSFETARGSIEHDVSAYLKKPVDTDEFRAALARIAKKKGLVLRREDELHQAIGRHIREARKQRGLTLKQMSRRTSLSVSLLSQIERAESSASVSSLWKVATALDLRLTELFGDF